jgi:hypothetical protein
MMGMVGLENMKSHFLNVYCQTKMLTSLDQGPTELALDTIITGNPGSGELFSIKASSRLNINKIHGKKMPPSTIPRVTTVDNVWWPLIPANISRDWDYIEVVESVSNNEYFLGKHTIANHYIKLLQSLNLAVRLERMSGEMLRTEKYIELLFDHVREMRTDQGGVRQHKTLRVCVYLSTSLLYEVVEWLTRRD